jgi:hypothetical protein
VILFLVDDQVISHERLLTFKTNQTGFMIITFLAIDIVFQGKGRFQDFEFTS